MSLLGFVLIICAVALTKEGIKYLRKKGNE